jgi:hypothetical protein
LKRIHKELASLCVKEQLFSDTTATVGFLRAFLTKATTLWIGQLFLTFTTPCAFRIGDPNVLLLNDELG